MSVFAADGKTYDDSGRLVRRIHVNLLTSQLGFLIAVTENSVFSNNFDHVLDNSLDPIYTKQT